MRRQTAAGADTGLADNVQAGTLAFTYFDDAGAAIAVPTVGLGTDTNIRRIAIQMTFQFGTHTLAARTTIQPRNVEHESNLFF